MAKQLSSGIVVSHDNELTRKWDPTPAKIREMRKDPTISLARLMVRAPIIASPWSVERDTSEVEGIGTFIEEQVLPLRFRFLEAASQGLIDFGWQPFELVWSYKDSHWVVTKIKPLLQDITTIVVNDSGDFDGFKNGADDDVVVLSNFKSALFNIGVECDNHYGSSYMANAYRTHESAQQIMRSADIYDKKIAGAHWVIYFPDGVSLYNGVETMNELIAKDLINSLENSGSFAIPTKVLDTLENLSNTGEAWKIELIESSGSGANFEERLSRCDRLLVRAFGVPERSILEGQFGTKAEADSHGDFALLGIDLMNQSIADQFNVQVVRKIIRLNFGPEFETAVYVKAQPLSDTSISYLRQIYSTIMGNADGFISELASLDVDSIRDRLQIPYTEAP